MKVGRQVSVQVFEQQTQPMPAIKLKGSKGGISFFTWGTTVFFVLFAVLLAGSFLLNSKPAYGPVNWFVTVAWSLYSVIAVIGLIGWFGARNVKLSEPESRINPHLVSQ